MPHDTRRETLGQYLDVPSADVRALVLRCEGLERERDEARVWAQRLAARLRVAQQIIETLTSERDYWRATARREQHSVAMAEKATDHLRRQLAALSGAIGGGES